MLSHKFRTAVAPLLYLAGLIALCAAVATTAQGEDWNLFAPPAAATDPAVVEWQLFDRDVSPVQQDSDQAWNVFAASAAAKPKPADTRPVVEMRVPSFACFYCRWWTERGDRDLPFQIQTVPDNRIGELKLSDGSPFGWPVFVFTAENGVRVSVPRVARNVTGLLQRWDQYHPQATARKALAREARHN